VALVCLAGTLATVARAAVQPDFFGVVPQGPLSARDYDRMQGVVGTLRVAVYWSQCEPRPGKYDFAALDELVGLAADHGMRVMPAVYGSPRWVAADTAHPPLGSASARRAWAVFLRQLVGRYGHGGTFWRDRQRREPVRIWQVWNEPNFVLFWRPRPSPRGYARLLQIASRAIRATDPRARIALAGVAPVGAGLLPWEFLRRFYRVPGVKRDFDLAAVHPYATSVAKMSYQIRQARRVMADAGDGSKPLLVSELGVASVGSIPSAFVKGPRGQARFLRRAFETLIEKRRDWRLAGVDWFTWRDVTNPDPHCAFCQGAGLFDVDDRPKPAWNAYKRVVALRPVR
jgi:hypothetical protein